MPTYTLPYGTSDFAADALVDPTKIILNDLYLLSSLNAGTVGTGNLAFDMVPWHGSIHLGTVLDAAVVSSDTVAIIRTPAYGSIKLRNLSFYMENPAGGHTGTLAVSLVFEQYTGGAWVQQGSATSISGTTARIITAGFSMTLTASSDYRIRATFNDGVAITGDINSVIIGWNGYSTFSKEA
jgi:hypothetical protein